MKMWQINATITRAIFAKTTFDVKYHNEREISVFITCLSILFLLSTLKEMRDSFSVSKVIAFIFDKEKRLY